MTGVLPPIVLLPFVLALLPFALPLTVAVRRLGWCAVLVAAITVGLAAWAASGASGAAWLCGSGGVWRNDPLGRTLPLLPSLCWLLTAVRCLQPGEAMRTVTGRRRRWPVAPQLAAATSMALCRADLLALVPVLMGVLLLVSARLDGDTGDRSTWLAAVPPVAIGVAIVSATLGTPARWSLLASHPTADRAVTMASAPGLVLVSAPLLLLAVALLVRPVLLVRSAPLRGLVRLLVLPPVLCVALRSNAATPVVGPLLLLIGVGAILLALLLVPGCRGLMQRVSLAALLQFGASLVAIDAGGPGGIAAALMLAGFGTLLLPAVLWFPSGPEGTRLRNIVAMALVGLPPFGPFAAGLVLLVRLWSTHPVLALFVLAAAGLSALSVLDAFGREPAGVAGERVTLWLACVAVMLAATAWLGVAMPTALSDWLLLIGEAYR